MLTLTNHIAKVSNFNPRCEKHGDENKLAGDIKFETCCARAVLDQFDPTLRPLLFRVPGQGETLVAFNDGDGATGLRLPKLRPLGWDEDFNGYTLTVHSGLGLVDPLVIEDVDVSNFSFEALEGGSVKVAFRASCHPDQDQSGALCELIQETVEISLAPPAKKDERQADLVDDATADARNVLVVGLKVTENKSRHLYSASVDVAGGANFLVSEAWASRPSLDEIAIALNSENGVTVEFTPAVRGEYEKAAA